MTTDGMILTDLGLGYDGATRARFTITMVAAPNNIALNQTPVVLSYNVDQPGWASDQATFNTDDASFTITANTSLNLVTALAPTSEQASVPSSSEAGTITIPISRVVTYFVDGEPYTAGRHVFGPGTYEVSAQPISDMYTLDPRTPSKWVYTFSLSGQANPTANSNSQASQPSPVVPSSGLANTGQPSWIWALVGAAFLAVAVSIGIYARQNKLVKN